MTNEELRKACELAGLVVFDHGNDEWEARVPVVMNRLEFWAWSKDDPALPAYVASLLVAKVREKPLPQRRRMANLLDREMSGQFERAAFATDEQRIRAAVAALGVENELYHRVETDKA